MMCSRSRKFVYSREFLLSLAPLDVSQSLPERCDPLGLRWRLNRKALTPAPNDIPSTSEIQEVPKENEDVKVLNELEELTNAMDQKKKNAEKLVAKRRTKVGSMTFEKSTRLEGTTCFAMIVGPYLIMGADGQMTSTNKEVSGYSSLKIHSLVDDRIFAMVSGDAEVAHRVVRIVQAYCRAPYDLTVEYAARLVQDEADRCFSRFSITFHNSFLVGGRNVNGELKLFEVCQSHPNNRSYKTRDVREYGLIGGGEDYAYLFLLRHASRREELFKMVDIDDLEDKAIDFVGDVIHAAILGDPKTGGHITTATIPQDPTRGLKLRKKEPEDPSDKKSKYSPWMPFLLD